MKKKSAEDNNRPPFFLSMKKNLAIVHRLAPGFITLGTIELLLFRTAPFVTMILSAKVVDMLVAGAPKEDIVRTAAVMVIVVTILELLGFLCAGIENQFRNFCFDRKNRDISWKAMKFDYEILERNETQELIAKASGNTDAMGGIPGYLDKVKKLVGAIGSSVAAIVTMAGLLSFLKEGAGSRSFFCTPWADVILFGSVLVSIYINSRSEAKVNRIHYESDQVQVKFGRIYWFFFNMFSDYTYGKDIRIFKMLPMIEKKGNEARDKIEEAQKKAIRDTLWTRSGALISQNVFICMAYLFVGAKALLGVISLGDLTKYVGAITILQSEISALFAVIIELNTHNVYLESFYQLMDRRNEKYEGTLPVEKRLDNEYVLEFKNVSFHYPNNDRMVLRNVSFCLNSGEKIAIVGPNGAGKTTFIKLMCRLYDPTEGEILLNGIDIRKYDYDEYIRLFSIVFQDFKVFAFSVAENVAAGPDYDEDRVVKSLKDAGIYDRISSMDGGINALLLRDQQDTDEAGIEISGGEKQKIALARALYRNAPMVILDEPTSALDPIAEQDIYMRFNEMVQDKSAIFISHRMSSCRFCDRVIVFDDGQIVESGTHEQLTSRENGLYRKMWEAQARYYV